MAYVDVPTDMKNGEVQYLADYLMNAIRDEDGIVSEQIEAQKLLKEGKTPDYVPKENDFMTPEV